MTIEQPDRACPSHTELTSMLLHGSERHVHHLRVCPACSEWFAAAAATRGLLEEEATSVFEPVCPGAEAWAEAFDDPRGPRDELQRHLAECPDCAALWRFLHEAPTGAPGGYGPSASRLRMRVAAATIVTGLLALWASPPSPVASGSGQLWRGRPAVGMDLVATATWDGDALEIRWQRTGGASDYLVRVWALDGEVLVSIETHDVTIRIDRGDLSTEDPVYWVVEARRDGAVLSESAPQVVRWSR